MKENCSAIDFLQNFNNYYLTDSKDLKVKEFPSFHISDISLYKINRITFEDKAPRKEALENVISAMRIEGTNLIYLILSDGVEVNFYLGVARNLYKLDKSLDLSVNAIGENILKSTITGNFRGSIVEKVSPNETRNIVSKITNMKQSTVIEGVPGVNENKENFQTVDRLVDVMCGDPFGVLVIASTYSPEEIFAIQKNLENLYTNLSLYVKHSIQEGTNSQDSSSSSHTTGTNKGTSTGKAVTEQDGTNKSFTESKSSSQSIQKGTSEGKSSSSGNTKSTNNSTTDGTSTSKSNQNGTSNSKSVQDSQNTSSGSSESETTQNGTSTGSSIVHSYEKYDKSVKDWIEYLDKVIFPRLDYGKGKGMFSCCSLLLTVGKAPLRKLSNTYVSLYSGNEGNRVPLRYKDTSLKSDIRNALMLFQIPIISNISTASNNEEYARAALSQTVLKKECAIGNWYSTGELSLIIGLPQKEVHGLSLKEEIEFGLNYSNNTKASSNDVFEIGKLVEAGVVLDNTKVNFDRKQLNKHIFVTGVTGSGKTTTCQNILLSSNLPFMVIEPAKTEYRILKKRYDDLIVFTLGNDTVAPFRLNPFEFFPHESITSHVDMVKASIEAAFDMEAAIPQIIELAIYRAYEKAGWNIETNTNEFYEINNRNPFAYDSTAFPTLSDVIAQIDNVVQEQGFADRLRSDYIGSIKARLQSLTIGAKGQMLNTKRSVDFTELIHTRAVLEIEEIKSGNEKAFVMGLVMSHLNEAIKAEFFRNPSFKHITLIEEAHRLLSKFNIGDSPNKKHGSEIFADMLSEVRKYGESLIIADQIPDKMIPEVLKNTNTKIVHRLFAQDDKNAIGNTMALTDEQKNFLSSLDVGRAVVFSQGYEKAIQVQMTQITDTSSEDFVSQHEIHMASCKYLFDRKKNGIIPGLQYINITEDEFDEFMNTHRTILRSFNNCLYEKDIEKNHFLSLRSFVKKHSLNESAKYFAYRITGDMCEKLVDDVEKFLQLIYDTTIPEIETKKFKIKRDPFRDSIRK